MTHRGSAGLEALDADVEEALESVTVPSYVLDSTGVVRWLNAAARQLVGDCRGRHFTSLVAAEDRRRAQEIFAQKVVGTKIATDTTGVIIGRNGERIEIHAHDFPARVIQHETDHLDGVLFVDRMRSFESLTYLDEYSRYWAKD